MSTTTIRVSTETRDLLHDLSKNAGIPMHKVVEDALEVYRREQILEAGNAAFARLRQDPAAWEELQRERSQWDATLADGLDEY